MGIIMVMRDDNRQLNSRKVMVAYASAGNGHKSAACAIAEALRDRRITDADAHAIDILNHCTWFIRVIYRHFYRLLVFHFPRIYRFFYFKWEQSNPWPVSWARNCLEPKFCIPAQRLIAAKRPNLIVSTHFLATGIAAAMKRQGRWNGMLWHVLTDFQPHGFQIYPEVDGYIVPTADIRQSLCAWGVPPMKVAVLGIPCSLDFYGVRQHWQVRSDNEPPRLLLNAHGIPLKTIRIIVRGIATAGEVSLVVVGLANDRQRRIIAGLVKNHLPSSAVYGHVDNLAEFFKTADLVVCKAGGLAVGEALAAARPMAICHSYPGQEKYNLDFLMKHGAIVQAGDPEVIVALAKNPKRLAAMVAASDDLTAPRAALAVADMIENEEELFQLYN
jgi:processive 1,2-diacylglycerol beta-glucosyltransferase